MKRNRKGQAAVLAYLTVVVLTVLGGALLNQTFSNSRHSQIQQQQAEIFYLAEGGVEDAISQFSQAIANFQVAANTACYPNPPTCTPIVTAFTSGGSASSVISEAEATPRTVADPDGTSVFVKNYHITTTVQHPNNSSVRVTLHQLVARRIIYTFQHAVFYDGDLEWLPGRDMTLSGRVHSNSDMYLGANTILTIDSGYVKSAGKIFNQRKDDNTVPPGTVQIKNASTGVYVAMAGLDSNSPTWTTDSQTRWGGVTVPSTVQSDVHGVTKRAVPVVGSTQPGGFYDTNANLKVTNDPIDPTKCLIKENGTTLTEGVSIPFGTCTSTTTLYNNREGKTIKMTELDVAKLGGGTYSGVTYPNHMPTNGLIYATRNDATSSQQPGVRLINGSQINSSVGLTLASNDPVYIKGNFNTTSWKPTAIIGDAVNLLSTNWSDANSSSSLSSRVPTSTTVNAAFVAGINTTTTGHYNGGLENYPRLHEAWTSSTTLSIRGSFVSLWNSQIATGNWVYGGSYYTAPTRAWTYETSFSDGTHLPPFTPYAVEMKKGAWWKQ